MRYLAKEHIILINRKTVEQQGGNFVSPYNLLKEGSLTYLIEMAEAEMFEKKLYPKIADVAALYMHSIISNHTFQDGNKRTGLLAALIFLNLNGSQLKQKLAIESFFRNEALDFAYDFTLKVANGDVSLEECKAWFEENIISL